ncbi:MAG: protein-S-isoprenylcysteine O-methyltransferase Ste14 [Pseudohongiellaceae bacterium]|jgi:protein-S-isoprenylcysteine O-methyltransferase Ste14
MNTIKNILRFLYSLICYAAGVGSLVYFIAFVNDLYLPKTVNTIVEIHSITGAILINLFAISLFGLQHSIMARGAFKHWLSRFIHPSIERSTYVLSTALAIGAMCSLWVPFGPIVWQVESEIMITLIRTLALLAWGFLLLATFMLNHFELFGLSQTFNPLRGKTSPEKKFKTPGFYMFVRHPIQTGVLIGMWTVPVSTVSHLFFVGGMTLYIFVGLYFEEKDLLREFGVSYKDYMARVKRIIPFIT